LADPVNNTPAPMNAVDIIASSIIEGLFHSFNIMYENNIRILIVLCSQGGLKTNSTLEIGF